MIQLLSSFIFSEILLIMVILLFETSLMVVVIKVGDAFMKTFARVLVLLLFLIFLLMTMPRLYNIVMFQDMDQNHLFEATLEGVFLFLAIMIDRLQHYVRELSVRRKELSLATKSNKELECQRKEVNDAEANTIAQRKKLLEENQCLRDQLSVVRARVNDLDSELGTRAKETITLCRRIEQQESELGTKTKEANTFCRKIKQLESQLESKTKEITTLRTRVKQLESELETKAEETNVLSARLKQLEFERERDQTKQNATSLVRLKETLGSSNQKNQLEGSLFDFDLLLDGNETLRNLLRPLPWRLSH